MTDKTKKRPVPKNVRIFSDKANKVFSGVRFDVYQWEQEMFDGTVRTFEVVKRNDTVVILSIDDEGNIILIKEKQPHWDEFITALPGGVVDHGEDIYDAARRELEEETGHIFDNFHLVDVTFPNPGIEWGRYIFVAKGFKNIVEKKLDGGEETEVIKIPILDFVRMVRMDELHYPLPFAEKLLLKGEEAKLLDMFENPEKYMIS